MRRCLRFRSMGQPNGNCTITSYKIDSNFFRKENNISLPQKSSRACRLNFARAGFESFFQRYFFCFYKEEAGYLTRKNKKKDRKNTQNVRIIFLLEKVRLALRAAAKVFLFIIPVAP